ncbi:uncharacterized protein K02A2.6-like [Dendronephthya gigantea]|uniref:uncharacterized protein K02A2.6-like n=1 Tax=Dendronephthya gigantea TaxID=151771 RepID=UPI00106938B6|nr:uncharacterized protein K02A2.6-like [Dendronephthya gigantea]
MATSSAAVTATKGPKLKVLPFDPHGDRLDLGKRWEKWFEWFERDLKYNGCDPSKTPEIAKMALLIYAGTDVENLHDTLPEPGRPDGVEEADWTVYEKSKTKLEIHFSPKQCNDFAIFELLRMKTEPSESITSYATRLRKAAKKCNFTDWSAEKMIKSLIISNMYHDTLRLKFLQKDRTLDQILDIARKKEDAVARKCPALTRVCNYCKKKGHYASKCFKKQKEAGVKRIEEESQDNTENDSDTDEYDVAQIGFVNNLGMREKPSLMRVRTNDQEVLWQPDTGTQKNVWDEKQFRSFEKKTKEPVKLSPTNIKLFAYGGKTPLSVIGSFKAVLAAGDRTVSTEIYVTSEPSAYPLLSEQSAKQLQLVKYNESFLVKQVSEPCKKVMATARRQEVADMIADNPEVFTGKIGKAKTKEVSLMIDDSITPVVQKQRRIPFNLLDRAENKIQDLLDQDIIERVPDNQPRSWVSPPVIAPKPDSNDIRFCIDMRMANEAIQCPCTQIPTMADIVNKFQGAERFTKLDLKEAYHQFVLDEPSRNITTFYGPDGLYRYKRLNYGTKSAQDILQLEMHKMLSGVPNQVNIADDILIGGSVEEHDTTLQKVLSALTSNGITVNPDKCIFDVEEVCFVGLVFNK